ETNATRAAMPMKMALNNVEKPSTNTVPLQSCAVSPATSRTRNNAATARPSSETRPGRRVRLEMSPAVSARRPVTATIISGSISLRLPSTGIGSHTSQPGRQHRERLVEHVQGDARQDAEQHHESHQRHGHGRLAPPEILTDRQGHGLTHEHALHHPQ